MTQQKHNPSRLETLGSDLFAELARAALAVPVALPETALEACKTYVATLLLWSQRLSLTAAKSARSIAFDHILDSLYVVPFVKPGFRVADIGSGAGFPGVPLAIASPEAAFVLVEPRRKRANFLREVARQANLLNVELAETRAENLVNAGSGPFDLVVSRAVGPTYELLALSVPLVKPAGLVIAMKGPKGRAELGVHPAFTAAEIVEYCLPNGASHLLLVHRRR